MSAARDGAGPRPFEPEFVAALEKKGAEVTSDFRPGEHVWALWDALLPEVIDWMLDPATA